MNICEYNANMHDCKYELLWIHILINKYNIYLQCITNIEKSRSGTQFTLVGQFHLM